MEIYKSRAGDVGDRSYWEMELDKFWSEFDSLGAHTARWPARPRDAWERFVRVIGLELVEL